jgi:hypothetical protein
MKKALSIFSAVCRCSHSEESALDCQGSLLLMYALAN